MTDIHTSDALAYAREQAIKAWYLFTSDHNLRAEIPDWSTGQTESGDALLTVEVVGPGAAHALRLFACDSYLRVGDAGDQRPGFDYGTPGRTVCVWRRYGVWVELWHPDPAPAAPESVPSAPAPSSSAPSQPAERRSFLSPSGRLKFTRRDKTTKETNPA